MSENPIQTKHNGIIITYDEHRDSWLFTLRGRDRSSSTLTLAKEAIEKPVPKEKEKPFEKIAAWEIWSSDNPERVEITGIAESNYGREPAVWIKASNGRRKENVGYRIYPATTKNDELAAEIIARRKKIDGLRKECEELRAKLEPLKLALSE